MTFALILCLGVGFLLGFGAGRHVRRRDFIAVDSSVGVARYQAYKRRGLHG